MVYLPETELFLSLQASQRQEIPFVAADAIDRISLAQDEAEL